MKGRRRLLIYPSFQLTLVAINFALLIGAFAAIAIQASRSYAKLREMGASMQLPSDDAYYKFIEFQANTLYGYLAVALVLVFVLSGFLTLFISHRLAGPLIRLRRQFEHMAETGKIEKISFRKGDFFSDLPPIMNRALERLLLK
jgi:hypothetical protein